MYRIVSIALILISFFIAPSFGGEALSLPKTYNLSRGGGNSFQLIIDFEEKQFESGFVITVYQNGKASELPSCYADLPIDFFEITPQSLDIKNYNLGGNDLMILEVVYASQKRGPLTDVELNTCHFLRSDSVFKLVKIEKRCGWFINPTPGNTFLKDRDDEWLISQQGGHQALGDTPTFKDDEWVNTNNNYGYGCACLKVVTQKDSEGQEQSKDVLAILGSQTKSLDECRYDHKLPPQE